MSDAMNEREKEEARAKIQKVRADFLSTVDKSLDLINKGHSSVDEFYAIENELSESTSMLAGIIESMPDTDEVQNQAS